MNTNLPMSIQRALCLTTFLLFMQNAVAQPIAEDSLSFNAAKSNLTKRYAEARNSELLLFQGSDYAEYESVHDEHPYFLSDDWLTGSVRYNNNVYENAPLQYDIHSDKLITENPATGRKIELVRQHVSWFKLNDHHFIFLDAPNISAGYYEVLVDGKATLLAFYHKAFQESTTTGKLDVRVEETKRYFIADANSFSAVKGKSSLLDALKDQRSPLQQEMKRRKLSFSRDKEQALIESVRIYNTLTGK